MDEPSLNAAIDRYACGDPQGFPVLHRELYPRLVAYLTRLSGSTVVADDLVQETFLRVHRARATFSRGAAVVPWVYAIARNVHIDYTRASRLRPTERLPSDPGQVVAESGGDTDAESTAIAIEMAAAVQRVLARIPAAQRDAFVLIRYEGLSVEDASSILGTTQTAVKLRAFRAYEALRAELDLVKKERPGEGDGAKASVAPAQRAPAGKRRAPQRALGRSR